MPFLGKTPAQGFVNSVTKDDFTPNGTTTAFTLSKSPATVNEIEVYVGNVRQEPTDAYSVSGTTLAMTEAPATGTNFYVMHIGGTTQSSTTLPGGSVVPGALSVSGDLAVDTSTLKVDSTNNRVGIGTTAPTQKLHIIGDTVIDKTNNGYSGLRIHDDSGGDYNSYLDMGRNQSNTRLWIRNSGRTQATTPWENATASPIVSFGRGGIAFGSDTASADTLDDYDEGTWTPIPDVEGAGTLTASGVNGTYTKIGRHVHLNFSFDVAAISGTGSTKAIQITGMPFAPVSGEPFPPITVRASALGTSVVAVTGYYHTQNNFLRIEEFNGTSVANLSDHVVVGSNFKVSLSYIS